MTIYTEFTLNANIAGAASLSIILGIITWVALLLARSLSGSTVAAFRIKSKYAAPKSFMGNCFSLFLYVHFRLYQRLSALPG